MISAVENAAATPMKPRNHAPIGDCANEWIELIRPLRVRKVPKLERQNAPVTSVAFQTSSSAKKLATAPRTGTVHGRTSVTSRRLNATAADPSAVRTRSQSSSDPAWPPQKAV